MSQKRSRFINVYFNRYVEQALSNINTDYLPFLNAADRLHIVKRKSFLKEGQLEEKLLLLAKLGHPFILLIGDKTKTHSIQKVVRMLKLFIRKKFFDKKQAVRELKDAGAFAMTDIDVVKSLMLAANIYNSPMYNLVNSYSGVTDKIYQYEKDSKKLAGEITAAADIDTIIIKAILVGTHKMAQEEFETLYKITVTEFLVLSFLSKKRQAKMAEIKQSVGLRAAAVVLPLQERQMINVRCQSTDPKKNINEYWISGFGENVLIEARKYFIKHITG